MTIINAAMTRMEEIEIFGVPALFTPYKVSRATVHLGMYCYEVQARSGVPAQPFALMEQADEGFYGTVLTPIPLELPDGGRRVIEPGDFFIGMELGYYTPAEFEEKYLSPDCDPIGRYGKED